MDAALDPDPAYRPAPAELREVLRDVEGDLSDEGGLVEPETLERFGLTAVRARTRLRTLLHAPRAGRGAGPGRAPGARGPAARRRGGGRGCSCSRRSRPSGRTPPFSSARPRRAAALLVALLPRVGWLLSALFVCGWLGTPEADRAGTALVLAAALAPTPLLLPRAGLLWSVPALAPLLGAVALAPLFVGVAALASTAWRRAGLAAAGFLWLAVAEVLTGRRPAVRRGRRHARARELGGLGGRRGAATPCARWCPRPPWRRRWCGWPSPSCCRFSCAAAGRRWTCWRARLGGGPGGWPTACSGDLLAATTELDARAGPWRAPRWAAWWP